MPRPYNTPTDLMNSPHSRNYIRLKTWDYREAGVYFVTICTQNRQPLFGRILDADTVLSDVGQIVSNCWLELPDHFPTIVVGEHIVMPDHFHGIVRIAPPNRFEGEACLAPTAGLPGVQPSLGDVVGSFKSASTRQIRFATGLQGQRIWQRGYHDRRIRNVTEFDQIRCYIQENPTIHRSTRQRDGGPPPGGTRVHPETSG